MNKKGSTSEWTEAKHKATEIINVKTVWISWYDDNLQGLKIQYMFLLLVCFLSYCDVEIFTDAQKQPKRGSETL